MKVGDKVVCITECIMYGTGTKTTTLNKIYTIMSDGTTLKDNRYIIDDQGDPHWFSNAWHKYFRTIRKEKLLRLKSFSDEKIL